RFRRSSRTSTRSAHGTQTGVLPKQRRPLPLVNALAGSFGQGPTSNDARCHALAARAHQSSGALRAPRPEQGSAETIEWLASLLPGARGADAVVLGDNRGRWDDPGKVLRV